MKKKDYYGKAGRGEFPVLLMGRVLTALAQKEKEGDSIARKEHSRKGPHSKKFRLLGREAFWLNGSSRDNFTLATEGPKECSPISSVLRISRDAGIMM